MSTVSFNTHVPGYEVLAELGRSNARVLKARHVATGDLVAIKQYAFATDASTLQRFERESQLMTQIDHPNIVRVREVQLGAAMPYVVMDFVEGGDLRGLLRQRGHLDVPTTIRLGLQLTGALRAIHPLHVVHRDIKPENVLYRQLASGELHFLLTDFGIAKLRADDGARTRTGQSLMTYEYAAPEQFDNPRQVDEAADYYALGVVLYECLTGKVPFVLQDQTGLAHFMQRVLTAPIPAPTLPSGRSLPPSLSTLLTSLLARNPAGRLRNTHQVELLLEQSRVEHLKANWSAGAGAPPVSTTRTIAGPVAAPAAAVKPADPRTTELVRRVDRGWTWWVVTGMVLAGIVFGLYSRQPRRPSTDRPSIRKESGFQPTPDSAQSTNEPTADMPATTEADEAESVQSQGNSEPTYQITPDSTETGATTTVVDSVALTPPDSAR